MGVVRRILRFLAVILLISTILLLIFRWRFNKPIRDLAKTQVVNTTSDLINDAIDRQMAAGDIQYDRIVYFEKDLNGRITP